MRRIVEFVDTSILVELIGVPGKAQQVDAVRAQLPDRARRRVDLVLPTAAVIETGNHIHHVGDGRARRRCATTFAGMLDLSARGEAPWVLHDATWDAELLDAIRTGSTTGSDLVEHATRGDKVGLVGGRPAAVLRRCVRGPR